ncbi:MAG: glycosyltransferase [Pseudomonadota bacterium]
MSDTYLSLIIPVYNEAHRIEHLLDTLSRWSSNCVYYTEILLISDGSRDQTDPLIQARLATLNHQTCNTRLLTRSTNRGKGAAVAAGIRSARGRYIAFADADLSAPLAELDTLIDALTSGADLVIGTRRTHRFARIYKSPLRDVLSIALTFVVQPMLAEVIDTQCGLKAYRRACARHIVARQSVAGFAFDIEHLLLAKQAGFKIHQQPIVWHDRPESKVSILDTAIPFLRELIKLYVFAFTSVPLSRPLRE